MPKGGVKGRPFRRRETELEKLQKQAAEMGFKLDYHEQKVNKVRYNYRMLGDEGPVVMTETIRGMAKQLDILKGIIQAVRNGTRG